MFVNLVRRTFCLYVFLIIPLFSTVWSQCIDGYEITCVWSHDQKSALRWVSKTESGVRFIQVTDCQYPDCGTASISSPWLPPRPSDTWMALNYRLYGTSSVYLRLYLRTEDGIGQHQVFSKAGNYAHLFTEKWTEQMILIPATSSRHKLLLKAHTPYKEAFVAVRDINLEGSVALSSAIVPQPTMEVRLEEEITTLTLYETDTENYTDRTGIPEDYIEEDNEIELEEAEESQNEDQFEALENNFIGVEELRKGYSKVMDPQLCKYQ